jgi:hypothetical protein
MSKLIFEIERSLLEKELNAYSTFLDTRLRTYNVPCPNLDEMTDFADRFKANVSEDIGKSFEELFKHIVSPNWKIMFDADNIIDTGKTLDEQKAILGGLLESLRTHRKIDTQFMTEEIRAILNTQFLNQDYKYYVLLELLESEYRLCNPDICWKDALLDRIRIMFYSGLFIGEVDKIEDVLDILNSKTARSILPSRITCILKELIQIQSFDNTLTLLDIIHYCIFISIGCGSSDDYMDLEEDIANNKITGITQCTKAAIDPKDVLSTTIEYLKMNVQETEYTRSVKKWFIDLMSLMYVDMDACFEYCKHVSPYAYNIIFQRKG